MYKVNLDLINKYMESNNISLRETAKIMDINCSHLSRILNSEKKPGAKVIEGLVKLGFKTTEIFCEERKQKKSRSPKEICNYMNALSGPYGKNYSISDVYMIMYSDALETKQRKDENLKLKGNTKEGRELIYKRIANIVNNEYQMKNIKLTSNDIYVYKRAISLEGVERNLCEAIDNNE